MSDLSRIDVGNYMAELLSRVRRHVGETPETAQMEDDLRRFRDTTKEDKDAGRGHRTPEEPGD